MSTIQSAARMTAGSCSTTSTELPWSRRAAEHGDEVIDVRRMEPHGRLVQDVDEIDEIAVELPGHLHTLALAAGQRRHATVERQVPDADVDQVPERPAHPDD